MIAGAMTPTRTNRSFILEWWRSVDHLTVVFLFCLIGTGIILSMAASPAAAARLHVANPFYFLYRHALFAFVGIGGAFVISLLSPTNARRIGVLTLVATMCLMVVVLMAGVEVKGSTRWLRFGIFSLQPSEFAKPAFIVFAAWMFSVGKRDPGVPAVTIVFVVYLLIVILLIQQPDFGQSFLITLCFAAVFFFAGLSLSWMLFFMGISLAGAFGAYAFLPHVQSRVNRFLSPAGEDNYQTERALEAISNGRFFGRGPGEGAVKFSLPDGHTDFIFAVTAEEFGFLISIVVILLLAGFVIRCFRNALKINDYFCQLAVAGLATMIGMQTIINLYVNLNMAPAKGMTLPFISYGGSSMLALCFTAGLVLAFTRRRPGAYGYGD
jgi:cell division protein FtsW